MALGKRGGYCTSHHGAGAAETIGADSALRSREVPGASMGCWGEPQGAGRGQAGLRGPTLALKRVLSCWARLWRGSRPHTGGQDTLGRGREEGWKPVEAHLKCQEKFIAKAGSCWCARAPLPLAAPPHAYSCIFMSVRLQMAQL